MNATVYFSTSFVILSSKSINPGSMHDENGKDEEDVKGDLHCIYRRNVRIRLRVVHNNFGWFKVSCEGKKKQGEM